MPGDGWTLQGPNRAQVPLTEHRPMGEQQDGHPALTPCPREGQDLLPGKVGGRGNGGRAGSGPAPPGARLLVWGVSKGKTITFQHKKAGGCQALLLVGEQRSTGAHMGPNRDRATWGHVRPALAMPTRSRTPQCHQHGCCDVSVPKDLAVRSQESTCLPSARRGLSPSLGQVHIRALPVASGPPGAVQPLCTGVYFGFNIQGSTQGVCSPAGAQDGLCWG